MAKEGPAGEDDKVGEVERSLMLDDVVGSSMKLPQSGNCKVESMLIFADPSFIIFPI